MPGLAAGPGLGWIDPDELLGDLLLPLVSLSVALILYEGGLTLKFAELPSGGYVVRNLVTVGLLITWVVAAAAARLFLGLPWGLAWLLGAILVVTGPTVVGPLLRYLRPSGPVGPILHWEGIVIDPLGALLAVLVFEVLVAGGVQAAGGSILLAVGKTVVFGGGLGALAALLLTLALHRHWVPSYLDNAVSVMLVVGVFALANHAQTEAGLLAVTVMGMTLANQRFADVQHLVDFKENLKVLLLACLFILLAARLDVADLRSLGVGGVLFVMALILVARPLSVLASTWGSRLSWPERAFVAWVAPRGIVAAAVGSVFALRLEALGLVEPQQARVLGAAAFVAIIGTVAVYGLTAPAVARRLGVAEPDPQGLLIVGGAPWARALAQLLHDRGLRVLLVDSNRSQAASARLAGVPTYTGSILAEHAVREMSLGGLGRILALTPNEWVNVLAVQRFERIFGRANCYQLATDAKQASHAHLHGRRLFGAECTHAELARRFAEGASLKATKLSAEFDYDAFCTEHGPDALVLLVVTEAGKVKIVTAEQTPEPGPSDTLISLVPAS